MTFLAPDFLTVDYRQFAGEDNHPEGWVFHWPASDHVFTGALFESKKYLRAWEDYHVNTHGWRGIAYDYAIDMAGRKFRLRGTGRSAATSGDYDEDGIPNNAETDAILCIIGARQHPSVQMVEAAREVIAELGGKRDYIIGHREARGNTTACPGPYVMRDIVEPLRTEDELTPEDRKALDFAAKLREVVEVEMGSNHRFAKYVIEHLRDHEDPNLPAHTHDYSPGDHTHEATVTLT